MGEHPHRACGNITNSMMFHASLIGDKAIKLATGTSNLSHMHRADRHARGD
jgi:hypothetical protein